MAVRICRKAGKRYGFCYQASIFIISLYFPHIFNNFLTYYGLIFAIVYSFDIDKKGNNYTMDFETILSVSAAVFLFFYLIYTIIRPEKF
jgi:K+-transporting ATPase KdpF subunit